jgi:hypothetical protein
MNAEYRYRPGQIVPGTDLKIIMPVGSGGMGSVYQVEETSVEAPFVMKVIHAALRSRCASRKVRQMQPRCRPGRWCPRSPPGPAAIRPPTPVTHPRAVLNCNPPFTIDAAGHRVPKPECL